MEVEFKFMVDCKAKISDRCDSGNWVIVYEIWIMILDSANGQDVAFTVRDSHLPNFRPNMNMIKLELEVVCGRV